LLLLSNSTLFVAAQSESAALTPAQNLTGGTNNQLGNTSQGLSALSPGQADTRKLRPGDKLLVFDFSNSQINSYLASNPKPLVTATAVTAEGTVSYPPLGPTVNVTAAGATLSDLSKKFNDLERRGGVINPNVVAILRRPDIPDANPRAREAEIALPPNASKNGPEDSALLAQPPAEQAGAGPLLNTGGSMIVPESVINGPQKSVLSTALNSQLGVSIPGGPGSTGLTIAQQLINMSNPGSVQSSMTLSGGMNQSRNGHLAWSTILETIPGVQFDSFTVNPGESWSATEFTPGQPGQFTPGTIQIAGWVIPHFRSTAGEPGRMTRGNFRFIVGGGERQLNPLITIRPGSDFIRWFEGVGRWGDRWQIISREPGEPITARGRDWRWIPGSFTIAIWPGLDPWREFKPGWDIVIKGKEPWWEWSGWKEGDRYVPGYSTFENQMDPRLKKGLTGTESYAHPGTPDDYLRTMPSITDHPGWPQQVFVGLKLPREWWEEWQRTWPGPAKVTIESGRPWNPPWRFPIVDQTPGRVIITLRRIKWPGFNINFSWRDWQPGRPGSRWWWLESGWTTAITPGRSVPAKPPSTNNLLGQSPPWTVHNSVVTQAITRETLRPVWLWTDNSQPFSILKTAADLKEPFEWTAMNSISSPFTLPGFPGQNVAAGSSSGSSSAAGGGGGGSGMVSFAPAGGSGGQGAGGGGGGGSVGGCLCGLGALNGEFDNSVSNTVPELAGFHVKIQAGILTLARLATKLGGGNFSVPTTRTGKTATQGAVASRAAGVVIGARAKGGEGSKITGQVFFSSGGPIDGKGGLDEDELIDVNGLDNHQYVSGRILKADKNKIEIATRQGKHLVIATSDICNIRSPRVVNFNIPLTAAETVDPNSKFTSKTGPIEFCRSESALRAIQKLSAHIENDEPIKVVSHGLSNDVRPLVGELKNLLQELEKGKYGTSNKVISMKSARRISAVADSAYDSKLVMNQDKGGYQSRPYKSRPYQNRPYQNRPYENRHNAMAQAEAGAASGRGGSGSRPSGSAEAAPEATKISAIPAASPDPDKLDEQNVEWCRDFVDWWQTEGTLIGGDSLERISRIVSSGLQGRELVEERFRLDAPKERLDQLIAVADSLLSVQDHSASSDTGSTEFSASGSESFPMPFNEKGTIVRACGHGDGAPCTVRFCTEDNRLLNVTTQFAPGAAEGMSCTLGNRIRFSGAEIMPDYVSNATSLDLPIGEGTELANSGKLWSVQEAHHAGILDFALKGDGKSVDHCRILMTNQSCKPLRVCVPEGQFFLPDKQDFQIMMMTEDRIVNIPQGSSVWLEVDTLGASVRKFKRPPPAGVCYRPDCYPDAQAGRMIQRTWEWANYMNRCQAFSRIASLNSDKRAETIAQIAVWRYLYKVAEILTNETVTRDTVQAEYFKQQKDAAPIYPEKLVDKLWAASDLVMALAKRTVGSGIKVAGSSRLNKVSILPTGKCGCGH
jgi:hypothetical protein